MNALPSQVARDAQVQPALMAFRYEEALAGATALHGQAMAVGNQALASDMAMTAAKAHANRGRHTPALVWAERAAASADEAAAQAGGIERQAQAWAQVAAECARGELPGPATHAVGRDLRVLGDVQAPLVLCVVFTGLAFTDTAVCRPEQALDAARGALAAVLPLADDGVNLRRTVNLVQAGLDAWYLSPAHGSGAALLTELRGHCEWQAQRWNALPAPTESSRASGVDRPPRLGELPYWSVMEKLQGHAEAALSLAREHQHRTQRVVPGALQARVDELGTQWLAKSLRLENADLRSRSESLAASVRRITTPASTDALTGLPNRRALEALWLRSDAAPETAAAMRAQARTLAMLDIDNFKGINDSYWHTVGDAVLREAAQDRAQALRHPDRLGHCGGEELMALLTGLSLNSAAAAPERRREHMQAHGRHRLAPGLTVTVSVGLTDISSGEGFNAAVARADALLYRAKCEGRIRVVRAPVAPEPAPASAPAGAPADAPAGAPAR